MTLEANKKFMENLSLQLCKLPVDTVVLNAADPRVFTIKQRNDKKTLFVNHHKNTKLAKRNYIQ